MPALILCLALLLAGARVQAQSVSGTAHGQIVSIGRSDCPSPCTIKVSGSNLVNGAGQVLKVVGFNMNGSTNVGYSADRCARNDSLLPIATHMANARAQKANIVRLFTDEQCWLGINGAVNGGASYQTAVQAFVTAAHNAGMYVLIDLSSAQPGTILSADANIPNNGPDADHSITFWSQVAAQFKNDPGIIFELFNEPSGGGVIGAQGTAGWQCLFTQVLNCGVSMNGTAYTSAGFDHLVAAIRNAGALTQPIDIAGLSYSHNLNQWLQFIPLITDSCSVNGGRCLVAQDHVYNTAASCADNTCLTSRYTSIEAAGYPVLLSEIGEYDCQHSFIDRIMALADQLRVSYIGYTWTAETCTARPSILSQSNPPIASPYGIAYFTHFAAVCGSSPC
jgi:endoglucanase